MVICIYAFPIFCAGFSFCLIFRKNAWETNILSLPVFLRGADWALAPTNGVAWIEQSEIPISVVWLSLKLQTPGWH